MNKEIKEILDKLSNRKHKPLINGLRDCQLKNIEHPFITKEEYIDKILDYITNLQKENERLKEELNGKQLREIHKINNYDYFKEMTNNWNREDFSRRCYDLCNEKVDLQQIIEKAVEYIKKHLEDKKYLNEIYTDEKVLNIVVDILNGRSDE